MSDPWFLDDAQLELELRQTAPIMVPVLAGYTELGELARGGQGVVYTGRQSTTGRIVAIKLLPPLPAGTERRRFERELELLARLDHPNVVGILDSGTTDDGRRFLVMELVDGPTIDRAPDVQAWTTNQRDAAARDRVVALMAKVCDGVASAHRRGIVHRDLKPGNVRLDREGTPKVLDFGLAKDLDGGRDELTRGDAGSAAIFLGSLQWCSPEQARGQTDAIDSRSDVWSLGMMLYRTLTGAMPFPTAAGLHDVLAAIVERTPVPMRQHCPRIPSDLETIVAHCLEKSPEQRYQSASELGAELRRYLDGEPIAARRHSTIYLLRKSASRHRGAFAFAALALLSLVAGLLVAIGLWQRAEDRREFAVTAQRRAEATMDFFAETVTAASPNRLGPETKVIDLLRRTDADLATRLDDGDARCFLLIKLTEVYASLSQLTDAERTATMAIEVATATFGPAARMTAFAHANRAQIWHQQGRYREVVEAMTPLAQLAERSGWTEDAEVGHVFMVLGLGRLRLGDLDGAEQAFAIAAAAPPVDEATQQLQAAVGQNLASIAYQRGDREAAVARMEQVVALRIAQAGPEHSATLDSIANLAFYLAESGAVAAADAKVAAIIPIAERRLGPRSTTTLNLLNNRSQLLHRLERLDEAIPIAEQCLAGRTEVLGALHPHTLVTRNNLAMMHLARGDAPTAIRELEGILAARVANGNSPPLDLLGIRNNIARARNQGGDVAAAIDDMTAVLRDTESQLGADHWLALACRATLGRWLHEAERDAEALPLLQQSLAELIRTRGREHADTGSVRATLRATLQALGRSDEAAALEPAVK
ncbi:MAG: serine/threonine-protein kinase [Planctomycetes bacterium]|jgi:tetratricopeptide (TPR) repeat protein|nr:serine/threonine-protein kinase [Planctomycetota bacterium]